MLKVTYNLTIAKWSVNSDADPRTEFIDLETSHSLVSPNDVCLISVYAPPAPQPGLLDQAVGAAANALGFGESEEEAFSVQIRGNPIKPGDQITIELTSGDTSDKVMTAEIESIHSSFGQTKITGRTGMQKLANTRLNQVYENQSLNQIVNDLANQAGIETGEVQTGSTYPYYVVHDSKNLLRHIKELSIREGMDLFFDTDNKLTIKAFNKTSANHAFRFGAEILDLQLFAHKTTSEHILVYGESPASNQGSDTWHWIAKDISPFQSEAGQGSKTLAIQDGVIRTKDGADTLAASKLGAIKDQSTCGRLKILGNPAVKLANAIEIRDAEKSELNGIYKVTAVRHVLNKRDGYLTFIGFTGQGGVAIAGGLLGGASGGLGL